MAGMQRFVTYIYAYENNEKSNNTGYAKVETRGNGGRIEIHFSSSATTGGVVQVGFLYPEGGKMQTISLGELRLENGRGVGFFSFQTETVQDTDISFDQIVGIKILGSNNQLFMSFWKDVELGEQKAEIWAQSEEKASDSPERQEVIKDAEQESLHTMEIPMRNVFPANTMEDIWRYFEKNRNCVQLNEKVGAVQIELNDLRELPKRYWYLGNNSFLLHGFFNYHHLLFGKMPDSKWFLGIPGIYERQERVMASVFGFPGFINVTDFAEEKEETGGKQNARELQRGVWYQILED